MKSSEAVLTKERLSICFANNGDGAGFAYVDSKKNRLIVDKGFFSFKRFIKDYSEIEDGDVLIHFRAASPQMEVSAEQTHPFFFDSKKTIYELEDGSPRFEFAVGHNGKLTYKNTDKESDTCLFVKEVLKPMLRQNPFAFSVPANQFMASQAIGYTNKMVIFMLDRHLKESTYTILNEDGGTFDKKAHWKDKVWYSNESYKEVKAVVYQGQGYMAEMHQYDREYLPHQQQQLPSKPYTPTGMAKSHNPINPNPSSANLFDNEYTKVDMAGWYWSYAVHSWINAKTGMVQKELVSRPNRPMYIRIRELRAESRVKAHDAISKKNADLLLKDAEAELKSKKEPSKSNPDKAIEASEDTSVQSETNASTILPHLTQTQTKKFIRYCSDWFKDNMGPSSKVLWMDKIKWARAEYRSTFSVAEGVTDSQVDEMILLDASAEPHVTSELTNN